MSDKIVKETKTNKTKKTTKNKQMTSKQDQAVDFLSNFVYMEDTAEALDLAFLSNKNLILWGAGGFGKSELSMAYFKSQGITPFVQSLGTGTSTDLLFGGTNLKLFKEEGKIEYLVENSFMNHEYVIFEELFDAQPYVLEQLKDTLSSGVFRNGSQSFKIKTKLIICCTNRTRESFAKDQSLKALLERFPLDKEVKWDSYLAPNYDLLFKVARNAENPLLSYICSKYALQNTIISPRIALVAHDVMQLKSIDSLKFIAEFKAKPELLSTSITSFKSVGEFLDLELEINKYFKTIPKLNSYSTKGDLMNFKKEYDSKISNWVSALNKLSLEDEYVAKRKNINDKFNGFSKQITNTLESLELVDLADDITFE